MISVFKYYVFADPPGEKMLVQFEGHKKDTMNPELDVASVYCNTCIIQLYFEFRYI